jgi:phospholipid/cholesterol/gamma-HCH transport system substrate-binding protein
MKKLLADENIKTISHILDKTQNSMSNVEQFTTYLVNNEKKLDELLKNISTLAKTGNKSFETIQTSANSFKELSNEILQETKKGTFDLNSMSKESFDKLNMVLNNLDATLLQTQTLIDNLNQSPSDILFKQKNIKNGPGE